MAQELAHNRNSKSLPTLPGTGCAQRSEPGEISKLVARCMANYGERKGVDMRLMVAEWHGTLGAYPADRLNHALSEHIRRSTWWPTIANLVDILREDAPAPGLKRHVAEPHTFAREGRTDAEEIAHRAAQSLKWQQSFGFGQSEPDPLDFKAKPKEASQEATVSYALMNSCAVRRVQGKDTCAYNCNDRDCNKRRAENP